MREHLFGYVLGALDAQEQTNVERAVDRDLTLQHQLRRIEARLGTLGEVRSAPDSPAGLADRTTAYIQRCEWDYAPAPASQTAQLRGEAAAGRWSLADLVVVAGIIIAASTLLLPAIASSRHTARVTICQDHLRRLGVALNQYSERIGNRFFPYVPTTGKRAFAGYYSTVLWENQLVEEPSLFICPDSQLAQCAAQWSAPTEEQLELADGDWLAELQRHGGGSYGYSLGVIEHGRHQPPRNQGRAHFPLMADAPVWLLSQHESANHAGQGFNLLFEDGHVQYFVSREASEFRDDPFVSRRGYVEPGVDPDDAVIAESSTAPVLHPISLGR